MRKRIAIIGGTKFDEAALDKFLSKLMEKYPDAIYVTGKGLGAERHVDVTLQMYGKTVEKPPKHPWHSTEADVEQIVNGWYDVVKNEKGKIVGFTDRGPMADVIVTVGDEGNSRPKAALAIWKRCEALREPENQRPYHNVAAPPKTRPKRKSVPKRKREAVSV